MQRSKLVESYVVPTLYFSWNIHVQPIFEEHEYGDPTFQIYWKIFKNWIYPCPTHINIWHLLPSLSNWGRIQCLVDIYPDRCGRRTLHFACLRIDVRFWLHQNMLRLQSFLHNCISNGMFRTFTRSCVSQQISGIRPLRVNPNPSIFETLHIHIIAPAKIYNVW